MEKNLTKDVEEEVVDICVIGSGLAGLSAANYLLKNNENNYVIRLIEARNRPGGRTHTLHLPELQREYEHEDSSINSSDHPFTVDVGGQWIGTDHFNALNLISRFGLKLEEQIYPHFEDDSTNSLASLVSMVSYHFPDLTPEEEEEVNKFVRLVDELGSKISFDQPWEMENAKELDVSIFDYVVKLTSSSRAQQEIFIFIQTILATSPHNCSFLFFIYYIASGGGMRALGDGLHGAQRWKVIGGAQQLSNCLLEELKSTTSPTQFKYYDSTPITSLTSTRNENGNNFILVQGHHYSQQSDQENVTTTSATSPSAGDLITIRCRRVILAMSPRLSNSSIQFHPPLPLSKQSLSEVMVPGACVKVLIPYLKEFWLSGDENGHPINGLKTLHEIFPIHNLFHSTVGTLPALVGLITGDHAYSYLQMSSNDRKNAVLLQIHQLFCSNSNHDQSSPAFHPVTFIEKSWVSEEFSGGCFACLFRPNSFYEYGPYLKSSVGFPNENMTSWSHINDQDHDRDHNHKEIAIEWASTETAPLFSGYMEGAILAGEEAAKKILSSLSH